MATTASDPRIQAINTEAIATMKVALVHHWLVTWRGGEHVFQLLSRLLPRADLFTLVCDRENIDPRFGTRRVHTSFLQSLPKATKWYPYYLPLFPWATRRLDLSGYDLIITSDAATLKGVRTNPNAVHICYCHTPMRYVWSGYEAYARSLGPAGRILFAPLAAWLRGWDRRAAQNVTHFVANSRTVAERIDRFYGRKSSVIFPPVNTDYFTPVPDCSSAEDYFLFVSQLVPYKRVDLIVDAFNRSGRRLLVIGEGSEKAKLMRRAHANIRFLGSQPDDVVRGAMRGCRALVFAGEEDFGIVLAEAQACGKPVVAYGRGGAREIVTDGITGVLFREQSAQSLLDGLNRFDKLKFDPEDLRASALRFTRPRFITEFSSFIEQVLTNRLASAPHRNDQAASVIARLPVGA